MRITQYITKFGVRTFQEKKINDADFACFALLSYFTFEAIPPLPYKDNYLPLKNFNKAALIVALTSASLEPANSSKCAKAIFSSKRYGDVGVGYYEYESSAELKIQYAAMTFKIDDKNYVIAYRGTDLSLYGWEESFLISLGDIPGQKKATDYLERTIMALPEGSNVYIVGHSKGGNFASYAAVNCSEEARKRIRRIFDFDGPGNTEALYERPSFKEIASRFVKLLPYDSMIGTLLNDYKKYEVIKAKGHNGLEEHSIFTWEMDSRGLLKMKDLSKSAKAFDKAFDKWETVMPTEKRKEYIEAFFRFLNACGIKELTDISGHLMEHAKTIIEQYRKSDEADKKLMVSSTGDLMKFFIHFRFSKID